jgi:sugar phosphate isomerase/epimerase
MTTRRSFLGAVAGSTAAALRGLARAAEGAKPPLGLQLWSVRGMLEKDVPGTLKLVKAWGFDEVETFDEFGAGIAPQVKAARLKVRAMHIDFDRLEMDLSGVLKDADAVGASTIINPSLPRRGRGSATREEILAAGGAFARWSRECRAAGKRFGYHIHGHEFAPAPEGTLFDVLAKESGPDVGFEADVFWVVWGGGDPVKLLSAHPGRVWFTHLKDMAKGTVPGRQDQDPEKANVPLGTGRIDVRGILAAGPKAGVEIHYLEDESADPAANIPKSVAYYRAL